MTTLREILEKYYAWRYNGINMPEGWIKEAYLAGQNSMPQPADVIRLGKELETDAYKKGKEDEKKRVVEIVEGLDLSKITKAELEKAL
jgi:hypothetical protein